MYLNDYDGYFFQGVYADVKYGGWKGLANYSPRPLNSFFDLNDTLDDEKLAKPFCCPADRGGATLALPREVSFHYWGTSYRTNILLIGQNAWVNFHPPITNELDQKISARIVHLHIGQVTADPAHLMLIADQGWFNHWRWMPPPVKADWQREQKPYTEWHIRPDYYNMAFLDGHAAFVKIRKAHFVTDDYSILPFKDLFGLAYKVQGEEP
jgi:prepilin-type processing-associated H-X9-DG protein